jgi:hypothetical protein
MVDPAGTPSSCIELLLVTDEEEVVVPSAAVRSVPPVPVMLILPAKLFNRATVVSAWLVVTAHASRPSVIVSERKWCEYCLHPFMADTDISCPLFTLPKFILSPIKKNAHLILRRWAFFYPDIV